jgi:hypothetical protein
VDVAERQDELQRHRCKRNESRTPFPGSNRTHQAYLLSHAIGADNSLPFNQS